MKRLSVRLALLAVLAVAGSTPARADPMVDFGYSWSVDPSSVITPGPGINDSVAVAITPAGTGHATLNSPTATELLVANVTTSHGLTGPTSTFQTPYSITATLTDPTASAPGSLTYSGTLSGDLTVNSSTIQATFDQPVQKSITLGSHFYTLTISPTLQTLPGPGASSVQINAFVTVSDLASGGAQQAPEPSSLALGGIAVALAGLGRRWRRRPA